MADPFNETQTIFRADTDSVQPTEAHTSADSNIPARASIAMKKPSIDFNAMEPDFRSKISAAQHEIDRNVDQQSAAAKPKGAGKRLWSMASTFGRMITKKFTGTSKAAT